MTRGELYLLRLLDVQFFSYLGWSSYHFLCFLIWKTLCHIDCPWKYSYLSKQDIINMFFFKEKKSYFYYHNKIEIHYSSTIEPNIFLSLTFCQSYHLLVSKNQYWICYLCETPFNLMTSSSLFFGHDPKPITLFFFFAFNDVDWFLFTTYLERRLLVMFFFS